MGNRTSGTGGAGIVGVGAGTRGNVTMRGAARLDSRQFSSAAEMNARTQALQRAAQAQNMRRAGADFNPSATRGVRRRFGR